MMVSRSIGDNFFYSFLPCFADSFVITSEGKVVKLRQESVHVIVLGFASAAITDEDIRDEFKHRTVCFLHCTCKKEVLSSFPDSIMH